MPFQVSLCAAVNQILAVGILLRPDVTSPCLVSLDLIATVTSGHSQGHTFLWELHSGTQVVFTTPVDQLIATCTLVDNLDRVFYFWVDKGTSKQQFYPFTYRGSINEPTYVFNNANTLPAIVSGIPNSTPSCSSITGLVGIYSPGGSGAYHINPTNITLTWSLPTNTTGLQNLYIQQLIRGVWTTVSILSPTDAQILTGAYNKTYYRIQTVYVLDHQTYIQTSCVYYLYVNLADYSVYIDDNAIAGISNTVSKFIITNYTLLVSDSFTSSLLESVQIFNNASTVSNTNITNYTLALTSTTDSALINNSNTVAKLSVTYLGGTIIGS